MEESGGPAMIVDCMTCPAQARRCDDCVVTVLRGPGSAEHPVSPQQPASYEALWSDELQLDAAESRAVSVFVGAGLVKAGAAARIRARRDSVQPWAAVRDAG